MKIGVISDTHGSLTAWNQALTEMFSDVDLILHAGDVLYHGPRNPLPDGYQAGDLAEAINACSIPILMVQGNCDSAVDQMVLSQPLQSPYLITEQPVGRVLVTHGHHYSDEVITQMAKEYQVDVWISGHSHMPVLEKRGQTIFLNPSSCSLPKGEQPHRGVAVITKEQIQLYDLDSHEVYQSLERRR